MNLFPSLFHHSGGIVYHWRAWKHSKKLWKPHRFHTESFLREWNPSSDTLYLIGPSAGHSLPREWLKSFETLIAFEPDALARFLFERTTGIRPQWIAKPFSFEELSQGRFEFIPNSAILFCNLLGQIHFDEEAGLRAQAELLKLSEHHPLASYHDILSGDHFRFEWSSPMDGDQPLRVKFELDALDPYVSANEEADELDLHVHPAAYLFQDEEPFRYQYWEWQITSDQTQIIEGVYSVPSTE